MIVQMQGLSNLCQAMEILLSARRKYSSQTTGASHPGQQARVTRENKFALSEAVTEMVRFSKMYNQYS